MNSDLSFYPPTNGGGLFSSELFDLYGPQVFSGTTDAPLFAAGVFTLAVGSPVGPQTETLTITDTAASVPEPASWAMMVGGFGLIGAAMRRKKVAVTFA